MKATGLNLAEWWVRMGHRGAGAGPELTASVQPVVIVGDHRELVSGATRLAEGHVQCFRPQASIGIGSFAGFEVVCSSPGGIRVRVEFGAETALTAGAFAQYAFQAAPVTYTATTTPVIQLVDPNLPILSRVREGRSNPRLLAADAFPIKSYATFNLALPLTGGNPAAFMDVTLPAGRVLVVECYAQNTPVIANLILVEFPAVVPEA